METDNIFVERKRSIKLNVKLLVELYPEVTMCNTNTNA
jgi:hypothetical protein